MGHMYIVATFIHSYLCIFSNWQKKIFLIGWNIWQGSRWRWLLGQEKIFMRCNFTHYFLWLTLNQLYHSWPTLQTISRNRNTSLKSLNRNDLFPECCTDKLACYNDDSKVVLILFMRIYKIFKRLSNSIGSPHLTCAYACFEIPEKFGLGWLQRKMHIFEWKQTKIHWSRCWILSWLGNCWWFTSRMRCFQEQENWRMADWGRVQSSTETGQQKHKYRWGS